MSFTQSINNNFKKWLWDNYIAPLVKQLHVHACVNYRTFLATFQLVFAAYEVKRRDE